MDSFGPAASNQLNNRQWHTTLSSSSCTRGGSAENSSTNACATEFSKDRKARKHCGCLQCGVFVKALAEARRPTAVASHGMASALPQWSPCKNQEHAWHFICAASAERARTSSVASSFERPFLEGGVGQGAVCKASSAHIDICACGTSLFWKVKKLWGSRIATVPFYTPRTCIL